MTMWLVRNARTGRVLAWRVRRADGWLERTVGFLPRTSIAPEEGLWFEHCSAVHTIGMRTPLDIVFLDGEQRVVKVEPNVSPHKLYVGTRGARTVAEFGPGFAKANPLQPGDQLVIEPV
ncbi:MAG TPA: DUF192 domain-containing protein [Candidatus Elarobacter sp.]|jgi:hypothetical protein|nr:DUF192 domain-containing protein [Candidatus Elarobacter sp.]